MVGSIFIATCGVLIIAIATRAMIYGSITINWRIVRGIRARMLACIPLFCGIYLVYVAWRDSGL